MSDLRQIPLFQPDTPEDINKFTELRYTIDLFQRYLLKEGKSDHTIKAFTSDLSLLAERTGQATPIGRYTTSLLNDFLDWLEHGRGVACSRKSYARRVTTLKVYFKWLHELEAIQIDPAKAVLQRSGPAPLSPILTDDEITEALLAARDMKRGEERDTRPEMLLRLLVETGIKKSEAMRLTPKDVNRGDADTPLLTIKGKSGRNVFKERQIPVSNQWVWLLDRYLGQYTPQETIFNCTARNLEYILEDIGDRAEIPMKLSFEMLRWTCAVRDFRQGMDEESIREKLGLSPISWVETSAKIHQLADIYAPNEVGV
ncbi:MAG: tyrosine-type recombinase/integrase [Anaerolineaceae bacterium]|nr:tyrosine-type recombinase/integrase [Anaerolineaceae bacterium]